MKNNQLSKVGSAILPDGMRSLWQALFDSELSGFMLLSEQGEILAVNAYGQRLLACPPEEWPGRSLCCFLAREELHTQNWSVFPPKVLTGDVQLTSLEGKSVTVGYDIQVIAAESGQPVSYLCQLIKSDTVQKRNAQRNLHRNALIREVHHQIKNHLQAVMSLLEISIMEQPAVQDVLHRSLFQVSSLAITFGLKSQHEDGRIFLCDLVESSANFSSSVNTLSNKPVNLEIPPGKPYALDREQAVPTSLVVNELILNAIKHDGDGRMPIDVKLTVEPDKKACLTIVNHTAQLPKDFDFESGKGLGTGLSLVKTLLPDEIKLSYRNVDNHRVVTQLTFSNALCWGNKPA
ncbi:sensor histidine kinase [methane-oxidizing endosymbiont of Gigantopelta aegis]|uniref:sensor histidine kinase n=1 Tax=methane-oxidizing endosymbiont of Gigantopelta aegis TaxID=2794938 RepID=UPI0018DE99F8|nr:histidine kinase dimerization/phosphoacceptor domain -containing protein [methane-oxidizing endosymbiont of Gigantopelta aegis]